VLVIVAGSAVPFNESLADAALYAMYGGEEAGNGLADVLFGEVPPSGRLPFTVFKSLDQLKPMEDYDLTSQPGRTHLYYDDRSVAKLGAPQFWFGYGLGYTRFAYKSLSLAVTAQGGQCAATASVTVSNVGATAGREVAQLYLKRPGAPSALWPLRGYQRTAVLAPGAGSTLVFGLTAHDLSTVRADGTRVILAGNYTVQIGGGNPRDPRAPATPIAASMVVAAGCAL
jgi:beta-glucosidase